MVMLTKRPETAKYDLSSLKGMLCGAAPLSRELQNSVARQFNVEVKQVGVRACKSIHPCAMLTLFTRDGA